MSDNQKYIIDGKDYGILRIVFASMISIFFAILSIDQLFGNSNKSVYLGIVFLISCAAMLALKELSESSDNDLKFNMLRRLGVDEKMINKTLFIQIGIFFMFPLILAIIHSIFGIIFCNVILETMGISFNLMSIIFTAILMVIIYGGYFLVTYFCSINIIKEK